MTELEARRAVREILGSYKGRLWWRTPNPQFGRMIPNHFIKLNRGHKIYPFIKDALEEYRAFMNRNSSTLNIK